MTTGKKADRRQSRRRVCARTQRPVITGAVLAAGELGWEVVGIRDGSTGFFPEQYPEGGLLHFIRGLSRTWPMRRAPSLGPRRPGAIRSTCAG